MDKLSNVQVGQMMKVAASSIRSLTEKNQELQEKVAHFERKEHAEKVASLMEEKGLQTELSFSEKVASLLKKENLDVIEEAVGLSAPQMKLASVHEDGSEGLERTGDHASDAFAASLATLD